MSSTALLSLKVTDVSEQKQADVEGVSADATMGEVVQVLLDDMRLPQRDPSGRALNYHALLPREGRHVHASERVGTALQTGDRLVLQPNIDAGRF